MKRILTVYLILMAGLSQAATSYTLSTSGATAWENILNWTPNGNPGLTSGDSALLTNAVMVGTNTISLSPLNQLAVVSLSNSTGFLVLDVTNCTLNTSALNLYSGGKIRIDNGGVLTNVTPTVYGSNVVVTINSGGRWSDSASQMAINTPGASLTVMGGGTWDMGGAGIYVGNTSTNCSLNISGVTVTNCTAFSWLVGGPGAGTGGHTMIVSNGASFYSSAVAVKAGQGQSKNTIWLGGYGSPCTILINNLVSGTSAGDDNNTINITNCALQTFAGSTVGTASGCTNNIINLYTGGSWSNAFTLSVGSAPNANYNQLNIWGVYWGANKNINVGNAGNIGNTFNMYPGSSVSNVSITYAGATNSVNIIGGNLLATATGTLPSAGPNNSFYASNAVINSLMTMSGSSNSATVVNSVWNFTGSQLFVGQAGTPLNNYNTFNASGTIMTNCSRILAGASSANHYNSIIISNGCYVQVNSASQIQAGYSGACTGNVIQLGGYGAMTTVSNASIMAVGNAGGCNGNSILITNCYVTQGGQASAGGGGTTSNTIVIAAGGYLYATNGAGVTIGSGNGNGVIVAPGGTLEAFNLLSPNAGCFITNNGGSYIFNNTTSVLNSAALGYISINNGTIGFHSCTGVDVQCSAASAGKMLRSDTKMLYTGTNGFYLNAATNLPTGQTYTFSPAYGPTNWASLTLTNAAVWQGGDVTIGSGGYLAGGGSINNNLTMQSGATLYADNDGTYISVASNLVLAGALVMPSGYTVPQSGTLLMSYGGTVSGTLSGIPAGATLLVRVGYVALVPSAAASGGFVRQISFSGYARSETLTNFPALVTFTNYVGFLSTNGYDLRFWANSTATGTQLNYEIDTWTNGSTSFVWVQVPTLTNNASIWVTWGNPVYNSQAVYTTNGATWDNKFAATWHESQTNALDSTINTNNALAYGAVSNVPGVVGSAICTPGVGNAYVITTNSASLNTFTNGMSISVWYKSTVSAGAQYSRWAVTGNWGYGLQGSYYISTNGSTWIVSSGGILTDGLWHQYNFVGTGNTNTTYRDGVAIGTGSYYDAIYPTTTCPGLCMLSDNRTPGANKAAALDEFRLESAFRSSNWVWAAYQNMASNTVFNLYGPVTTPSAGGNQTWQQIFRATMF